MHVFSRAYWMPKAGNSEAEYEDSFWPRFLDGESNNFRFAVADGATEASFSGIWARQIVRAFGKGFEDFYDDVRQQGVLYRRGNPSEIIRNGERVLVRAEDTLLGELVEVGLAPEQVDRPVARRADQPRRRVLRGAAELPGLERPDERILHRVLGEREVPDAEDTDQGRDHPPGLAPEEVIGELEAVPVHRTRTGRTSTTPSRS